MGWPSTVISRFLVFLVGIGLLLAGAHGVGLWADIPLAHSLAQRMDRLWYFTAAQQPWWPWALGGTAALVILLGLSLIVAVLRPRHYRDADLAQRSLGLLSVAPGAVADAIASSLEGVDGILGAQGKAHRPAGIPTISITVAISPHSDIDPLRELLESTAAHAASSFGSDAPSFRYFLRVDKL